MKLLRPKHFAAWGIVVLSVAAATVVLSVAAATAMVNPAARGSYSALPDLRYVTQQVAKARALPVFKPPGAAFDARKLKGKRILWIPTASSIPTAKLYIASAAQAGKLLGVKVTEYVNEGQPTQWLQGMQQAIAQKYDAVITPVDPKVLGPQVKAAKDAGIPVIFAHILAEGAKLPANTKGIVPVPFASAARLMADYAIMLEKGKVNALVITSNEIEVAHLMVRAIQSEFKTRCGAACSVKVVNVPVADWATKLQTEVQSELTSNSKLNVIIPLFDAEAQFAVPGITSAGVADRVKVISFNGSPFALKMIQDADAVAMDIGESWPWNGWATLDQALRVLAGVPPVKSENIPLRIFDDTNVNQVGKPPSLNKGFGNAFVAGYKKLWMIK
jgi:ribose transport system substrate-binding protein